MEKNKIIQIIPAPESLEAQFLTGEKDGNGRETAFAVRVLAFALVENGLGETCVTGMIINPGTGCLELVADDDATNLIDMCFIPPVDEGEMNHE